MLINKKLLKKSFFVFIIAVSCTKNKKETIALPEKPTVEKNKINSNIDKKLTVAVNTATKKETGIFADSSPRLPALIKAENSSAIGFQISGTLSELRVKAGDVVQKNQKLAILNSTLQNFEFQNAQLDVESKKLTFQQSQKKYNTYNALFKNGSLSKNAFEEEENNFRMAKIQSDSAEINLKAKKYALELTQLLAPFNGVITASYKSVGDFINPGMTVFDLVQTNDVSVFAQVPVAFFGQIKTGMIFTVINPLNQKSATITIDKLVPVVNPQSHTFAIYGKFGNEISQDFVPGMYVEIILK